MGDDSWMDEGGRDDSMYRTISSLRELVGPNGRHYGYPREGSNDDGPTSLKGTRFRRTRCSEDPGYFASTPLARFKHTRQIKMEAWQRNRSKSIDSNDETNNYKNVSNNFRSMFDESNRSKLIIPKNDSQESQMKIDDSLKNSNGHSSKSSIDSSSDSKTGKVSSPDRFRVTNVDIDSEQNSSKMIISNRVKVLKDQDVSSSSDENLHLLDDAKDVKRASRSTEPSRCKSTKSKIPSPDRFKVTKPPQSVLNKDQVQGSEVLNLPPFLKDFTKSLMESPQTYRDVSPTFRELSGPPRRRLSQCPEEDEEVDEETTKRPVLPRLHMDKMFFDSTLVEMKSQASSSSTIDTIGSIEDVWVKRIETRHRQDVGGSGDGSSTDGGSTMSSTTSRGSNSDSAHSYRSESTWGGGNPGRQMVALVTGRRHRAGGRHSVYHTVTGAVGGAGPPRVQQTHIPSIFEVFRPRSKSDAANQKKPSLMGHMRNAMGGSGGKGQTVGDEAIPSSSSGSSSSRGPVAKVIHLFRNRSQSAASADEKRKARAAAAHQQMQQVQQHSAGGVVRRSSLDKRRLSLGTVVGAHRGSDPSFDPYHAAILFRDSRGLPVADPFLEKVNLSDLEEDESQIFVKFFRFHKCYDLIPTSAKLVVFDTQLLVKKAFFALVYNGVRAAPLWDSASHKFVGMLTITDFIKILKMYYGKTNGAEWMQEMEAHKLDTWRKVLKDEAKELVSIGPDASLYEAISMLVQHRIHRLPVVDPETNNVLYILTHKRILRFLFLYINDLPRPSFMSKTLAELRVGTFEDVATARPETTIISALDLMMEKRVSALPIVDHDNKLIDIYAKFDVINLAAEKTYDNLDVSLKEANEHRNEWFEGVSCCSMDDTLYKILLTIVRAEVHRLVVIDDEKRVIGIISLSDILEYLVLKPSSDEVFCRSESPSVSESLAYSATQEETIAEGEEEEERERSPAQAWSQPQPWSLATTAPLTSA